LDEPVTTTNLSIRFSALALVVLVAAVAHGQPPPDPLAQARSLAKSGQLAKSEEALQSYLKANPSSAEAHFLLGYVLFREKRAKESLAEFTAGAALQHPGAEDLKVVASDYVMLGDYGDADKWYTQVVVARPDDADAWYLLGRTKFNESNFAAAASCFQRALTLRPRYVQAEDNLGLARQESNQTDEAKAAFQMAIDWQGDKPGDAQPFLNMGTLLASENDVSQALPYLERAVQLAPDNPKIHEQLAQVYAAQQNLPKAQGELEAAVALAPSISGLHFKLGQIYRKEGLRERAEKEFQICARLNSTHSSPQTPNPPR